MHTGTERSQQQHTPWGGMSREQIADFVEGIGGAQAAADYILSRGRSKNYGRNERYRGTHVYGKTELIEDSLDGDAAVPPRGRTCRLAPARTLGCDDWNAILACYPLDGRDRDVLIASAHNGRGETAAIAKEIGVCQKQIRNIQNKLLVWARTHLDQDEITAHLDDPITTERVARRAPSKAGRKPRGWVAPAGAKIIGLDLLGHPIQFQARKPRRPRSKAAPRVRVRPACPGQLPLFQEAA